MNFWSIMLVMDLLIPFTLLGYGLFFIRRAPRKINMISGYRTSMSMKNKDTWTFAHKYCGRIYLIAGSISLPVAVILLLCVINQTKNVIAVVGGIICFIEIVPFIVSTILTEKALKNTFDSFGNRR